MAAVPFPQRLWKFFCSLKLAIVLASAATLLVMGGSLVIHYHPGVFGNMDATALGAWLEWAWRKRPDLAWWVPAAGVLIALLGLNTLCCFLDWLLRLRSRWRKTGEYLIHLGFVLVLAAFLWGSVAGSRSEGNRIAVGETLPLAALPGYALRLEAFEPLLAPSGRPMDMINTVSLLRGEEVVARQTIRTNAPLIHDGLVVIPASFGRTAEGFRFFLAGAGEVALTPGARIPLPAGGSLSAEAFYPHAVKAGDKVFNRSTNLANPAVLLEVRRPGESPWRGWYFLRDGLPYPLVRAGVRLWPTEPVYATVSILTINRDPGLSLALAGGVAMLAGVILALFSFYRKRARGDRPEVG